MPGLNQFDSLSTGIFEIEFDTEDMRELQFEIQVEDYYDDLLEEGTDDKTN